MSVETCDTLPAPPADGQMLKFVQGRRRWCHLRDDQAFLAHALSLWQRFSSRPQSLTTL